jgi:hypothetical protein
MKKLYLLIALSLPLAAWAQCNTSNATDCDCLDGSSDCDLLPDITCSYILLADPEYQPEYVGELGVSVATPNIGHGPLRVFATDYYICGGDTIYEPGGLDFCDDGTIPKQLVEQRIYHKSGATMSYWEREAGTMTYHPGHGHFHIDDWGTYTLREEVVGVDPLDWPIIGSGSKLGFCLMDYGSCGAGYYDGYCVDDLGNVLGTDAPNYGLGGGSYSCGITNQGISAGYLDIYHYWLEGMSIILPDNICNGDYKIVVEVDPNHFFLEENDDNNVMVADITLTDQPENDEGIITINGSTLICESESVELSAPAVGTSYLWSNGETTATIVTSTPGTYSCLVERSCGTLYTDTITVTITDIEEPVITEPGIICEGTTATLTATGEDVTWYNEAGDVLGSGPTYETPALFANTMYYADNTANYPIEGYAEPHAHTGASLFNGDTYNGYLIFDANQAFTLTSIKVYTDTPGERTIELRNEGGAVLQEVTVDIPNGESRVDLNFDIEPGTNYQLGTNEATNNSSLGYASPRLYRNSGDVVFPYNIGGVASIHASSASGYYYYFYDWEYEAGKLCTSMKTAVEVAVEVCNGISEVAGIKDLEIFPNPNNGAFQVAADFEQTANLVIQVSNLTGQIVYNEVIGSVTGATNIPINLNNQPAGVYTVALISEGKAVNRQVIVE